MNANQELTGKAQSVSLRPTTADLVYRLDAAIQRSKDLSRPFVYVAIQIANLTPFRNRSSQVVVNNLFRELYVGIRQAVHPSQFVGPTQDGLGIVFEGADVGQVDMMSRRLLALTQHIIRSGHYNDLSSRWSDIIRQFLLPGNPGLIFPKIGWAIYPRDGMAAKNLMSRAMQHISELSR